MVQLLRIPVKEGQKYIVPPAGDKSGAKTGRKCTQNKSRYNPGLSTLGKSGPTISITAVIVEVRASFK
jgi:hypothetical protein